jgi:hypothetical protein
LPARNGALFFRGLSGWLWLATKLIFDVGLQSLQK